MSELKEHIFCDIDEVFPRGYCGPLPSHEARSYYLKSEADKVISKLKESVKKLILDNYLKDKELRHQKYKRCLAMAEKCHALYDKYSMLAADDANWEEEDYYFARWRFFEKWKYKWLELAEHYKERK